MNLEGFRFKKTKPKVSSSDDSDEETQINLSSTKAKKKTKPVVVKTGTEVLEKYPHLAKFLKLVCDEPGCDFSTKYPENFEIHLESHQSNSESEDLLADYYSN